MTEQALLYGIKKMYNPTTAQVRDAFYRLDEEDIQDRFDQYRRGIQVTIEPYDEPDLELVHSSDIRVETGSSRLCTCRNEIWVDRPSFNYHTDFAGYDHKEKAYAFSAHRRLLERFLTLTASLFTEHKVKMAYVRPRGPIIRLEGLNKGLDFDQFAMCIETMDCVLFLVPGEEDPLQLDARVLRGQKLAGQLACPGLGSMAATRSRHTKATTKGPAANGREVAVSNAEKSQTGRYALRQRASAVRYN